MNVICSNNHGLHAVEVTCTVATFFLLVLIYGLDYIIGVIFQTFWNFCCVFYQPNV